MDKNFDNRVERAVELFRQGYGCCQSVVAAFADLYGFTEEQAARIGAGFGGLVVLAGMKEGQTEGSDRAGKAECYKTVQELVSRFGDANGSIICAELLGLKGPIPKGNYVPDARNADYYAKRPCAAKVESAARIFADYLAGEPDAGE